MSSILISLTESQSLAMGRMIINETCSLCKRIQRSNELCIRHNNSKKIICKNCIRDMSFINLHSIIKCPSQNELNFK